VAQLDISWITHTELCKFIRSYKRFIFLYILLCILFEAKFKITALYLQSRYLLYSLHLDRVASEAVVVLVVRTSHSIEFCGKVAVCLIALPQVAHISIYTCVYVYVETLQTELCS